MASSMARQVGGYSSDSSVMSHEREGRYMKRLDRPRWWVGCSTLSLTSNESVESGRHHCCSHKNAHNLPVMRRRFDERVTSLRHATQQLWVTEVISGTGFYALTEENKESAEELRSILASEIGVSHMAVKTVVPRMVCAARINNTWERVMVRSQCSDVSCSKRTDEEKEQHWHVTMMEAGTMKCVPWSQLVLVTREVAALEPKARVYFLRRVHLKDDETTAAEAKEWLKSKILNKQMLKAHVFFRFHGRSKNQAEVYINNINLSDALVEAGYAVYNYRTEQREKPSEALPTISYSLQDLISSRESLTSQATSQAMRTDTGPSTLPDSMELIDHLMKKRKDSNYLTYSGSALNLAIKIHSKDPVRHQRLCEQGHASLNKMQILLRRLRQESPGFHEVRDLQDSVYEHLVEMFDKWKSSYKRAQKKSNDAIEVISDIFLSFANQKSRTMRYRHKCMKLESALNNEVLLQNEGQDLSHMLVPVVATKLMSSIEKLESGSGYPTVERAQTLHQFIPTSKYITPLTLETLAKDILKGLYHFHERGIAYKHLHPQNVLIRNGHAVLRPIEEQQECKIGQDWPFEGVEVANEDLGKPGDVFNFGLLLLWMACKGADSYYGAAMKYYCNVALIKMTMDEDPNQRPLVESMVCTNSPIFRPNIKWRPMLLKDYLREVFNEKCNTEEASEDASGLPSEAETGETTSESGSMFQRTEDDSGTETTESEPPKYEPSARLNEAEEGKHSSAPHTDDTDQA
ncbi:uncharacterized protein LOC123516761 isoform X2 [Portunus trituberculatus]|uniref:uncharacterized protein LOC123516761 isoform X2 n=2 Tax=Portunus trituberculatus TaxID=210409 RepID=UPI001E1CFB9D|nr:uncharacterized protein LOC123516761 isoform X2 [Portunus trituberculatus]